MTTDNDGRRRAAAELQARMATKRLSAAGLAKAAAVDPGTISDFLSGARWPQAVTRAKLEAVLDWPTGTIAEIADGAPAPDSVGALTDAPRGAVLLDLPAEVTEGMSPMEREELIATLKARAFEKAAEIRRRLDNQ